MTTTPLLLETLPRDLIEIGEKALAGQRLSCEEGLILLSHPDIEAVRALADEVRMRRVGETVYFATTLYIHPTNLCELSCPMCSFYAKPGWKSAWFLTPAQVEDKIKAKANLDKKLTEIHIVGGLWRECNLDYYKELFSRIKAIDENLHIKALTPVEYDFLAKIHDISIEEVFERMMSWGLGSLPGGGAEILVEEIRKKIAPGKITSDEYLNVHRIAHKKGLHSNITMLFGHIEEAEHIITHLDKVRSLQDETGGFRTFVPLKYHVENNALGKRKDRLKPKEVRRIYAVSRLMLDNIRNLKVLWNYVGIDEAVSILRYGANDLSATQVDEKIITMAGGVQVKMTEELLVEFISNAGRQPMKIHSGYRYDG
jgi:CofH subfamily radical SAM domain protein